MVHVLSTDHLPVPISVPHETDVLDEPVERDGKVQLLRFVGIEYSKVACPVSAFLMIRFYDG